MTIHLLYGAVGAGKTTLASRLASEKRGVCLSPDEWMSALYGEDPPAELVQDYLHRIVELMWMLTAQAARLGVDVVLDFGFWSRESRDEARRRARELGVKVLLYEIVCPAGGQHRRVLARTAALPRGSLCIAEATIGVLDGRVEPLDPEEARIVIDAAAVTRVVRPRV